MKKAIILISFICFTYQVNAQINFEKGYFINNENEKKSCLIKNVDWKHNPSQFIYKFNKEGKSKTMYLIDTKEFSIDRVSKYIRAKVAIDQSSNNINNLSRTKNPEFKTQTVFLKVILEGKSNLYYYEVGSLKRYFFNLINNKIEPLIYKSYLKEQTVAAYNNDFRMQLMNELKCSSMNKSDFEYLDYDFKGLTKVILKYNKCKDPNYKILKVEKSNKSKLNISLKVGLRRSTFTAQESRGWLNSVRDFDKNTNLTFGIEFEHIFGFNQNKWAICIEPSYQSFQSEISGGPSSPTFVNKLKAEYTSMEIPVGFKHYMFTGKDSKLFLSAYYVLDFPFKSTMNIHRGVFNDDLEIDKSTNIAVSFGYKHLDKYSLELRYNGVRKNGTYNHFIDYWYTEYSSISFLFGYTIF